MLSRDPNIGLKRKVSYKDCTYRACSLHIHKHHIPSPECQQVRRTRKIFDAKLRKVDGTSSKTIKLRSHAHLAEARDVGVRGAKGRKGVELEQVGLQNWDPGSSCARQTCFDNR